MSEQPKLPFVQFELAGTIGLDDGRYLSREPEEVLVVRVQGAPAPARRAFRKRKPKNADTDAGPPTVPLTVLTAIRAEPLSDEQAAASWLERLRDDSDVLGAEVAGALTLINRALHAHRVAALDPGIADVSSAHALAVRVGFGEGEGLADGRWERAIELPGTERRRRVEALAPQERIAAVLAGREAIDAATGALLRARGDLEAGRVRDAALQLRIGLEALLADTASFGSEGQAEDRTALGERRRITGEAANEALAGELGDVRAAELDETLKLCERVLRRRRAFG